MSALRYVWSRRITRIVGKVSRGYCQTCGEGGRMNEQGWEIGVIELFYADLAAAKAFYQNVFGLEVDREDDTSVSFVLGELVVILLTMDSARELVEPLPVAAAGAGARACFTIGIPDVDAVCSELTGRGVEPINGPVQRSWGPRAAYFADPGGYVFEFVTRKRD
jgi:lactoylglutathione lyase